MPDQWAKTRYLDASALVKLVTEEGDHEPVRLFFQSNVNFCATSLCLAEALGIVKTKWTYGRISAEAYLCATRKLVIDAWGGRIEINNVDLFSPKGLHPLRCWVGSIPWISPTHSNFIRFCLADIAY